MISVFCERNVYYGDVVIKHKEFPVDKLLPSVNQSRMRYVHAAPLFTFI